MKNEASNRNICAFLVRKNENGSVRTDFVKDNRARAGAGLLHGAGGKEDGILLMFRVWRYLFSIEFRGRNFGHSFDCVRATLPDALSGYEHIRQAAAKYHAPQLSSHKAL
ncbi:MAG: hypothetical protein A2806_01190 [Candidatus Terrybacteria bacterium RIFCSPHIGHO2_01_FULL_48_17]|uniref:Uncharacterized protein n=1 Tax=Candidatus Terrybacteria bacterium RIFCSPHIGHO2_01_FULL_48_17 TaxID=1802362 RepID=A0A1G2PKB7_9BACT|nr:MAG: hypothetical protein A2806_01190 [Candidatus Terrybacteria bacterium RIFCSPHIGHO2_01_FULL_48_17]OHA53415.1 MAG: hypothetical protein A3A30_02760 [Candidatus Terrybacteria bacterium RIFCSPLOWO2_01_FULL_48_14]